MPILSIARSTFLPRKELESKLNHQQIAAYSAVLRLMQRSISFRVQRCQPKSRLSRVEESLPIFTSTIYRLLWKVETARRRTVLLIVSQLQQFPSNLFRNESRLREPPCTLRILEVHRRKALKSHRKRSSLSTIECSRIIQGVSR